MTTATPPAGQPVPDGTDADRDATSQQNLHAQDHPKAEGDQEAPTDDEGRDEG